MKAALEKSSSSFPELSFAQERLNILKDDYEKLNIFAPEIIPNVSDQLGLAKAALDKYHTQA